MLDGLRPYACVAERYNRPLPIKPLQGYGHSIMRFPAYFHLMIKQAFENPPTPGTLSDPPNGAPTPRSLEWNQLVSLALPSQQPLDSVSNRESRAL